MTNEVSERVKCAMVYVCDVMYVRKREIDREWEDREKFLLRDY